MKEDNTGYGYIKFVIFYCNYMKKDQMGVTCNTHRGDEKYI